VSRLGPVWALLLAACGPAAASAATLPSGGGGPLRVQGEAMSDTPRVITNTREYCDELSARAGQLRQARRYPLAEADVLATEGGRLCAQGQIRPGVMRLRRAIMLLREEAPPGR
jgi:hypothetical protein